MEDVPPTQLIKVIDDLQASLAAAIARIEASRVRERHLIDELAQLRKQVHGHLHTAGSGHKAALLAPGTTDAAAQQLGRGTSDLRASSTSSLAVPHALTAAAGAVPRFTSTNDAPLYITTTCGNSAEQHAVSLLLPQMGNGNAQKIACELIITPTQIDFVQLRVRVQQEDFIGVTAVKDQKKSKGSSGMCGCFAPPATQEAFSDLAIQEDSPDGQSSGSGQDGTSQSGGAAGTGTGRYRIYLRGREKQPIEFEASQITRATLNKYTQKWLGQEDETCDEAIQQAAQAKTAQPVSDLAAARSLTPGLHNMSFLGEASQILSPVHISCLAMGVPPLERLRDWTLAYSTKVHGTSLSTLYRKCHLGTWPTLTVVKDNAGHVFGCYTPEGWRIAPRFYGGGESFVFQLEPHRLMWPWRNLPGVKNDFFQYSTPECLAVGGNGHFALHMDEDLLQGSSGQCGTFGSPCLAGREDFKVIAVEVWQVK